MEQHTPLRDRENPLGWDVALAVAFLAGGSMHGMASLECMDDMTMVFNPIDVSKLPCAISKADVVNKLIEIASTDMAGTYLKPSAAGRKALHELYFNRLSNSATFQSGYKLFEKESKLPVVPVTDFFFHQQMDTQKMFDTMAGADITQSLPKRLSRVKVGEKDDGTYEYLRGQNGEVLKFGELAGIVVFPAESRHPLLRAWLERRVSQSSGSWSSTVRAIGNARPNAPAVQVLRETTGELPPLAKRALPRLAPPPKEGK